MSVIWLIGEPTTEAYNWQTGEPLDPKTMRSLTMVNTDTTPDADREGKLREKLASEPSSEEVASRGTTVPPVNHEDAWKIVQSIRDGVKHLGLQAGESLEQFIHRLYQAVPAHLQPAAQPPETKNPPDAQAPRPQIQV